MSNEIFHIVAQNDVPALESNRIIRKGDILEIDPARKPDIGDVVFTFGPAIYQRDWFQPFSDLIDQQAIRGVVIARRTVF